MHKTIVSDTSCFIVLDNIGELGILKLSYGNILPTQDVADEFGKGLPQWVEKNHLWTSNFRKNMSWSLAKEKLVLLL